MTRSHESCSLGRTARETEAVKPTDKACRGQASKPAGCNASEPISSLVTLSHGGRALSLWAKTASLDGEVAKHRSGRHRGLRDDTLVKKDGETWETLPRQLCLYDRELKTEPNKAEPKWARGGKGVGAAHSSENRRDNITRCSEGAAVQPKPAERGGASDCRKAKNGRIKAQQLQRRLYLKSKREKTYRFYSLYDKVYHLEILQEAWRRVARNRGASGVDGQGIEEIEKEIGVEAFLCDLHRELKSKAYRPRPVRRVHIPKSNGEKRPLGIPTIRDRVVQMAVKIVIEPIFEAGFCNTSYGFRPKRDAHQAIGAISKQITYGKVKVIDLDLARCFDSIPHDKLMERVAERIADRNILRLIKSWLQVGAMEEGAVRGNEIGTPQGGVISPLLANIYLHQLDQKWEEEGIEKRVGATLVRYADDFLVLSRHSEEWLYRKLKGILEGEMGLNINPDKSRIVEVESEAVKFLGFEIKRVKSRRSGKKFAMCYPSRKSMKGLYAKIRKIADPRIPIETEEMVRRLNRLLRGWTNYFRIGQASGWFSKIKDHVERKVRRFVQRKRHKAGFGWKGLERKYLYRDMGLYHDYRVSWRRA